MLEIYFSASKLPGHLRSGPSGPYLDGFAAALERQGYSAGTAARYLRAAAHLGHVVARQEAMPSDIDLAVFSEHLCTCRCPRAMGGRRNHHTIFGARLFRQHLVEIGVCQSAAAASQRAEPCLVAHFKVWLRKHRGASDPTIKLYARDAAHLIAALGDDPERWEPAAIRSFFLDRASHRGNGTVEKLTTSLRAFLRYLAVTGRCRAGLADVVPGFASWRLADLPRYLAAEQVNRLIAACDGGVVARRRDRAIVLLLVRLGLRAGDVAQLRLDDIEWETGSLRVSGKSRYEVRLPLPQDVGDAIADYLACRPSTCPSDHVFLRNIAPFRPFRNGDGISSLVKRLMQRAGIVAPVKGAHVLRHTAATEMLRHGVPLEKIGLVLRHRGIDTTARYAKADVTLLKQIAQPWPEVL
ncbi:tyrosine-type recombinase/integrase [Mesorhizobium sp. LNJC405B00]|uniref:tyrosine-type recombinase/integrase n=1 Tax=Mesorhizobium sp. LNJC405B00 TaxID=1287281 RepID=UPI0003CEAF53|nr:tyrosine-type recombinase/integrase [Mesorhizobium sp. LNJC405B00]ESX83663.1 integrase [Mesorhizobium sp. LNJC405B00]